MDLGAQWRGGQIQSLLLARELAASGDAITVLARRGAPLLARLDEAGLATISIRPGGEAHPGVLLEVARAARRFAPDVIYAGDARGHGVAVWSGAARARPLVVHRRVAFPPGGDPFSKRKYAAADRFLAISNAVAQILSRAGVPEGRIVVIPDGLPDSAFVRTDPPADRPFRLVHVGSFDGRKGQELAVETVATLVARGQDVRVAFLGDGDGREQVERLAQTRSVAERCAFEGLVDDVPARLAASHALLMTSSSEGGSLAIVEAMAAGCPVLCHDIEGAGELVREAGVGRLIQGLNPEAWADAIVELIATPQAQRQSMAEAGRAFAATRTIAATARLVRHELERVVTPTGRAPGRA